MTCKFASQVLLDCPCPHNLAIGCGSPERCCPLGPSSASASPGLSDWLPMHLSMLAKALAHKFPGLSHATSTYLAKPQRTITRHGQPSTSAAQHILNPVQAVRDDGLHHVAVLSGGGPVSTRRWDSSTQACKEVAPMQRFKAQATNIHCYLLTCWPGLPSGDP